MNLASAKFTYHSLLGVVFRDLVEKKGGLFAKKILFLGASTQQIPPINYALKQGYYVITCDYFPNNPGHKLAHESHSVSTTDKEAVLVLARRLKIDGIVAYASDPAAPTQA